MTSDNAISTAPGPVKFYQVGSFAVGNRLLDPDQRSVQSDTERSNSLTCGHRACTGCGEALGARVALDAAMRATNGQLVAVNATGCLEVFSTPYPDLLADRLAALVVRERPGRGHWCGSGHEGQGPHRCPGREPGRGWRHRGYRLRDPVRHVRAQR